jgi:hypothetical protein
MRPASDSTTNQTSTDRATAYLLGATHVHDAP